MSRRHENWTWFAIFLVLGMAVACQKGETNRTSAGRLGSVRLLRPEDDASALIFLFSAENGWTPKLGEAAAHLTEEGAVVVGVDLREYLAGLRASDDGCHYVVAELEDTSERLQREFKFAHYESPILAGVGAGGTLAYAALAQAPAATVGGAVSVSPMAELGTKVPLCEGAPASAAAGGGFSYGPKANLPGWWRVAARTSPAELAAVAGAARIPIVTMASETDDVDVMVELIDAALEEEREGIDALPLTEIAAESQGPFFAVIYSGDGGWRDLDKQIGEYLATHGVSVVGVDSLRYFWSEKAPDVVAHDLDGIIDRYSADWKASKVIVVGYSFGAAVVPFAVSRLSARNRANVIEVSLLGLEARASFSIQIAGWFGAVPAGDAPEVLPEVLKLPADLVQCFYGEDEEETLCRAKELAGTEIVHTSGGHHFDGDYKALADIILRGAHRRVRTSRVNLARWCSPSSARRFVTPIYASAPAGSPDSPWTRSCRAWSS